MQLEDLGWTEAFASAFARLADETLVPARVSAAQREHYSLLTPEGTLDATLSGRLRHEAVAGALPVVGDWVAVQPAGAMRAIIAELLPRKSMLARKQVGASIAPQVLVANLDYVFLVTSLNRDFNPRRIERTLAMIWESGAQPVLLLSKLDLCEDVTPYRAECEAIAFGVPVHALSAIRGDGLTELADYLRPGCTIALVGSSGVGKSSLVNRLRGDERLAIRPVREHDERGRHATTARELFVLGGGGILIDTPGIREIGLWDAADGLRSAFPDIEALAAACRFGDCRHAAEPGCAVQSALASGQLAGERYASYRKLERELAHAQRREDPRAAREYRRNLRSVMRERTRSVRLSHKR